MSHASAASHTERFALVLQGGGALGAYQAGAYEALHDAGIEPYWVAGISIGAINAAIIAGNDRAARVPRLRAFWEQASSWLQGNPALEGTQYREMFNYMSAAAVSGVGVPGFFEPRFPPASVMPAGTPEALSVYDSSPLKATLESLVDFKQLLQTQDPQHQHPDNKVRLSVGAVNIRSGNFTYFDTDDLDIMPEHIMASGALPPGLPPVVIDGEPYWDGGLVSNTPLQYLLDVADEPHPSDKCIFQVDLFSARGEMPQNLLEVTQREKEIRFSSRTRLNTSLVGELQKVRTALSRVLPALRDKHRSPDGGIEEKHIDDFKILGKFISKPQTAVTIVHLIYRRAAYDTHAQDYEFSRRSVEDHWQAGHDDVKRTLRHREWRHREKPKAGVCVLDLSD